MPDPNDPRPSGRINLSISGTCRGFPITISREIDIRKLHATISFLAAQGLEAPPPPPLRFDLTADGEPICPRHGVVMRTREKQGDTWHSHAMKSADGVDHWCRGYPGPDSPGYFFEPEAEHLVVPPGQPAGTVGHTAGALRGGAQRVVERPPVKAGSGRNGMA